MMRFGIQRLVAAIAVGFSVMGCGSAPTKSPNFTSPNPASQAGQSRGSETPSNIDSISADQQPQSVRLVLPTPSESNRPLEICEQGYVSSKACQACHPNEYASWHGSYHRTMTQLATPENVRGDFNNAITKFHGSQQRFFRDGNQFKAELLVTLPPTPNSQQPVSPTRARLELPVALVTGSHHTQVYWYPSGSGRLMGMVPYFYLLDEKRWIPRNAAFLRPGGPDREAEWESWNQRCIRCHTTLGRPRHGDQFDTQVAEFGISCEACHGPGQSHVDTKGISQMPSIVNPVRLAPRAASQTCGQCHSVWRFANDAEWERWNVQGATYRPGDELDDTRFVFRMSQMPSDVKPHDEGLAPHFVDGTFWPDGMIRVTGREYNGLIESPCFQRGKMSCLSCHTMHQPADDPRSTAEWANDQLKVGIEGNSACLQCHREFSAPQALVAHSHHLAESQGSQCYNCHMPHTTYGILKATRAHQISSPDVAHSLTSGRPNACNLCHLDQTLQWTATQLHQWYGIEPPELDTDQQTVAASLLWLLQGDAGQRAVVAWGMNWPAARLASGSEWMAPFLAQLLVDPYPAVRLLSHRALRNLPEFADLPYDFVGSNAQQELARKSVQNAWNTRHKNSQLPKPIAHALDDLFRLLERRNDRWIFLAE